MPKQGFGAGGDTRIPSRKTPANQEPQVPADNDLSALAFQASLGDITASQKLAALRDREPPPYARPEEKQLVLPLTLPLSIPK